MRIKYIPHNLLFCVLLVWVVACGDVSDAQRMKNAETYMAEGSYRAAVIELKNAIQVNAKNEKSRLLLAQAYLKLGEGVNAEKELHRAKQLGSKDSEIIAQLAQAFMLQGKYKKALEILQQSGIKDKARILLLSGESYFNLSDYNNAEKTYIAAQKIIPDDPRPLLGQAKIFMKRSKFEQAKIYLEKAAKLGPENIQHLLLVAELSSLKGQNAKAEASYAHALKLNKAKDFTRQKFQALAGMAVAQMLQKKLDAASVSINALIKAKPRYPFVQYLQAWLIFQKKNYALANTILLDLHQRAPGYLPGLLLLGATSYALGNYEQANIYLSRFINQMPTHTYARKLLAATQLKLNQPEKAIGTLQSDIKKTDADLLAMMGQATALTGDLGMHLRYLRDAIKEDPDNFSLRKELAKTYIRQDDLKNAIVELQLLHKKNLNDQSTDLLLIYAQLRAGQISNARKLARKILTNKPLDPDLQAVMGDIDLLAGKRESARQHFYRALKLQKNHSYSQLSLGRMELADGNLVEADNWFGKVLPENKAHTAALLGRAQVAALRGDQDNMLVFLEKARTADVRAVSPRVVLARYYLSIGKTELALELADEIKQQYRDKSIGYQLEGDIYIRGKRYKEAQDAFLTAIKQEPSADLAGKLSRAYFLAGETAKGLINLKKALAKYPDNVGLRLALATHYQLVGNRVLAENTYRKLLDQQPSNIVALNNSALLLTDKHPDKARAYAKQAYQLAAKSMVVADTFGWILVNQDQLKKGLNILTLAASYGNNPTVKYHLAFALVKNGKKGEAKTILGPLVKSGIKFPEQAEAAKLFVRLQ